MVSYCAFPNIKMSGKQFTSFGLLALIIMATYFHGAAAADSANQEYLRVPKGVGGVGCGTSSCADTFKSLINSSIEVCFTYTDSIGSMVGVSFCYITGESGLSLSIELTDVLGILVLTSKGKVYFLHAAGCPSVVPVQNNNGLVFNYRTFYGYLAYQVFQTQTPGYNYFCQTCRTSALQRDPSQIDSFQGKSEILIRNIRAYSVVPCSGVSAQYLQAKIQNYLSSYNYTGISVKPYGSCVAVQDQYAYLQSCPINSPLQDLDADVLDFGNKQVAGYSSASGDRGTLYQLYCAYINSVAARRAVPVNSPLTLRNRIVFPGAIANTVVVLSCFTSYTLFDLQSEAVSGFC